MPEPNNPSSEETTKQAYEQEIIRLQAHIRELQAELSSRPPSPEDAERRDTEPVHAYQRDEDDWEEDDYSREHYGSRTSDAVRDIPGRSGDELYQLLRSVMLTAGEPLRLTANVLDTFANEAFRSYQPEPRGRSRERYEESDAESSERERGRRSRPSSVSELAGDILGDINAGLVRAIDRSLEIPRRAVDKFSQSYRQSEEEVQTTPEREASRLRRQAAEARQEAERRQREAARAGQRADRFDREAARASREASRTAGRP